MRATASPLRITVDTRRALTESVIFTPTHDLAATISEPPAS
jgi:hypothetical protein